MKARAVLTTMLAATAGLSMADLGDIESPEPSKPTYDNPKGDLPRVTTEAERRAAEVLAWYHRLEQEHRERPRFQPPRVISRETRFRFSPTLQPYVRRRRPGTMTRAERRRFVHEHGKRAYRELVKQTARLVAR